ncbi:MAG: hypothetical protein HYU66_22935, partial [Armatimonadetes bacterium]|nr:hypothetical protein [Armatimonadota bacterium]
VGTGPGALNIDEAWVRLPGLGGRWIFGRQYAGQDYETGAANPSLALGVGYYTGAALTGIRGQVDVGNSVLLTGLVQADDNPNAPGGLGSNMAAVGRADVTLPWWKNSAGEPRVKMGFQTVKALGNTATLVAPKRFNDNQQSREWSVGADLWVDVLKGLRVEYVNTYRDVNGKPPNRSGSADNDAQAIYAELGVLETPTFKLDIKGGAIAKDFELSHSIVTNPYTEVSSPAFALFDRPVLIDSRWNGGVAPVTAQGIGPTQGYDINLRWMIGSRPLLLRFAGSTLKRDAFNWMGYAALPLVQTAKGDVSISGGYIDVDATSPLRGFTKGGVSAVRVQGSFAF